MEMRLMERYHIPLRANVYLSDAPTREYKIKNISSGGLFCSTSQPLVEGTRVFMLLFVDDAPEQTMPEKVVARLRGTVRRSSRHGMAICFDNRYPFSWM